MVMPVSGKIIHHHSGFPLLSSSRYQQIPSHPMQSVEILAIAANDQYASLVTLKPFLNSHSYPTYLFDLEMMVASKTLIRVKAKLLSDMT